jgi:LDH2 family malate/lactate/ureidoglycolate dehydrogenase
MMPRLPYDQLRRFTQAILQSLGSPVEEADLVASLLIDAHLAGHDSHGVAQIPGYLEAYAEGLIIPGAQFSRERDTPSTAVLDGHWGFGHRLALEGMALAIEKASLCGISAVGAYHCYHVGHLGAYVHRAAEAGMIGLMAVNDGGGGQRVVPYGGTAGRLSTNPLAVGLPTGTTSPFILDMSTSVVAEGQIRLKHWRGEPVPLGWMIDALGNPTTDPDEFFRQSASLLPLGGEVGYKGFGLALAVEMLAGILGRAGYSHIPLPPYNNGLFMVVIDIGRFLALDDFTAEVQNLIGYIKSAPRAVGVEELRMPGEQAARLRQQRLRDGIELDQAIWERLTTIARQRGLQVPGSA